MHIIVNVFSRMYISFLFDTNTPFDCLAVSFGFFIPFLSVENHEPFTYGNSEFFSEFRGKSVTEDSHAAVI